MNRLIFAILWLSSLFILSMPGAGRAEDPVHSWTEKYLKNQPVFSEALRYSLGGESRYRMEYRRNYDFARGRGENDAFSLFRNRIHADISGWNWTRLYVQFQDAQSARADRLNRGNLFENNFDLRQGFVELKWPGRQTGWKFADHVLEHSSFRIGRQELIYGDERFIGTFEWSNVTQTFDALRYVYDQSRRCVDLFWAQIVKIQDNEPDSGDRRNHLLGIYWTEKWIPGNVIDTFFFARGNDKVRFVSEERGKDGPLAEFTLGNRWKGKHGRLDYGTEYAFQVGKKGGDGIEAFAFHQELGFTLPLPFRPRPNAEYNFGSGDDDPKDGHFNTFDNLFPTNHNKYGFIDFVSLQNIHDVKVGADIEPMARMKCAVDFHFFYLGDESAPWFNAGRAVLRRPNSRAADTLAKELDITLWWTVAKHVKFSAGYSRWFSGSFVEDTGAHDDADFFYVMSLIDF